MEQAFVRHGFADASVDTLREAASVSLRMLYKYMPSRVDMVLAALEYRHRWYMAEMLDDLLSDPAQARDALMTRVGHWMQSEAAHGCLFYSAVAADPANATLRALLERHKYEVATRATLATGLERQGVALLLIMEWLTQTWPLHGDEAVSAAKHLAAALATGQP